jgi:hypothetical protein
MLVTGLDLVHSFDLDDWFAKGGNMGPSVESIRRVPILLSGTLGNTIHRPFRQQPSESFSSPPDNSLTPSLDQSSSLGY